MENNATVAVIQDKRSQKKDGTYPLVLRVTYLRKPRYFSIGASASVEDWERIVARKARGPLKDIQSLVIASESKAQGIINSIGAFTFQRFQDAYNGVPTQEVGDNIKKLRLVYDVFEAYISELRSTGRVGTASSYNCAMISLQKYRHKLYFEDITPTFLNAYEQSMLAAGASMTTIGIYLRSLRTIFNFAVDKGIVQASFYPFGKRRYQIPTGVNIKKAITLLQVQQIAAYIPETQDTWEEQARDLWILSYLCNGMNIKDLCNLKYENIKGDSLVFIRQKTQRTAKSNPKPILAYLPEKALAIIEKWGQYPKYPDTYIFPFYEPNMDPERCLAVSNQVIQNINKWMKKIGTKLDIPTPITTYTARHTFSTVLKRSGASIEYISESLGHSDLKTTESYLGSFEDGLRKEMSKRLLG